MFKLCESDVAGNSTAKAIINACELLQEIIKQNNEIIELLGKKPKGRVIKK